MTVFDQNVGFRVLERGQISLWYVSYEFISFFFLKYNYKADTW